MYSFLALLCLLATACFALAFVRRQRVYLIPLAVLLAAIAYTHNWGLFFDAGCALAVILVWRWAPDRSGIIRDAVLCFGAAAILFLPWVPTLISQAQHTGAPWATRPKPKAWLPGAWQPVRRRPDLVRAAGRRCARPGGVVAAPKGAGGAHAGDRVRAWRWRRCCWPGSRRRSRPHGARATRAWCSGRCCCSRPPGWRTRAGWGSACCCTSWSGGRRSRRRRRCRTRATSTTWRRSSARCCVRGTRSSPRSPSRSRSSTTTCPTPRSCATPTPWAPVADPQVMDWRDALDRLKASRVANAFEPVLDRMPVGRRLLLVSPITENPRSWRAPWTELVRRRGAQYGGALQADRRFRCTAHAPLFYRYSSTVGVRAVLCQKVSALASPVPRNLELKAVDHDPEATLAAALALGAEEEATLHQRDTYFFAVTGRLKLREAPPEPAQLIGYARPDRPGASVSAYEIAPVFDPATLGAVLAQTLGVRTVVEKRRRLLLWRGVRIHLDRVAGLGDFVEIEAIAGLARRPGGRGAEGGRAAPGAGDRRRAARRRWLRRPPAPSAETSGRRARRPRGERDIRRRSRGLAGRRSARKVSLVPGIGSLPLAWPSTADETSPMPSARRGGRAHPTAGRAGRDSARAGSAVSRDLDHRLEALGATARGRAQTSTSRRPARSRGCAEGPGCVCLVCEPHAGTCPGTRPRCGSSSRRAAVLNGGGSRARPARIASS